MRKTVLFTLVLALLMGLVVPAALAGDGSLERVKKAGKLVIGIDDAYPPMEFRDENNQLVGFDIDLAREIGKRLGVEVEWVPTEWNGVILALNSGKFDIILSAMSITEERAKQVDFSPPYIDMGQVVVTRTNSNISNVEDLKGKVIGTQLGSTSAEAARTIEGIKELKEYPKFTEVFLDLAIGRIDAGVVDQLVANYYANTRPNVFKVAFQVVPEPIGIAYRKEDDSLQEAIDSILLDLIEEGYIEELIQKWLVD
ncbi:MAG: amino acid ABC transporter substrate-binding protein [Firmicutes bacterium]|nr:amino acid ABC transporter substrate-binding protein [Bacillota bacterium]